MLISFLCTASVLVFQFSLLPVWMRRCLYSLQLITILSQDRHGSWSQSSSLRSYLLPEAGDSPQTIQQNRPLVFCCLLITKIQYIQLLQSHQSISVGAVTRSCTDNLRCTRWTGMEKARSPVGPCTSPNQAEHCPISQTVACQVVCNPYSWGWVFSIFTQPSAYMLLYSRVLKEYWCPFIISNNY